MLLGLNTFCAEAKLFLSNTLPHCICSCWQHITACFCELDKEDLALEIDAVCEIQMKVAKDWMKATKCCSATLCIIWGRQASCKQKSKQACLRLLGQQQLTQWTEMCCDCLSRSRAPSKANNCPPNIESNIFQCVALIKRWDYSSFRTHQVTATQEQKCKWFMMGSIKAVQDKLAQIPDLR